MTGRRWLVFDCSYLCRRQYHGAGDDPGSVVPGVLRDVAEYVSRFGSQDLIFAFDRGPSVRERDYPWYKKSRRDRDRKLDPDEAESLYLYRREVMRLESLLLDAGFRNTYSPEGFEADDVLASCAFRLGPGESAVLVTADKDLDQCLGKYVTRFDARTGPALGFERTAAVFRGEWQLHPAQWAEVKAIAGCATDDVPGAVQVGESTAATWLRCPEAVPVFRRRSVEGFVESRQYRENLEVVKLPHPACPFVTPTPHPPVPVPDVTRERRGIKPKR